MCQYRAVGHPIATAVTEGLVELAAARDRHGSGGDPPPQLHCRTTLILRSGPSGIKFEALSHHACLAKLEAMMDYAGLRAEQKRLRAAGHPSRHRLCVLRRGDQPERRLLRHRRREDLRAGRRHHHGSMRSGAIICQTGVTEQGQGAEAVIAQIVGYVVGRADRARARHHRRHRQHALWRRHLGFARAPASAAKRPGRPARRCAATCSRSPAVDVAGQARRRSTSATAPSSMRATGTERLALTRSPASPISARTRCRRASRPS